MADLFFSITLLSSFSAFSQVSGTIYKDFNGNGVIDTSPNETGLSKAKVIAVDENGTALTVTYTGGGSTTNASGKYAVTGGTIGKIRLQFVLPDGLVFASSGNSGGTTIMFPTTATQNLAVNYPEDYVSTDPYYFLPCYVSGDPTIATSNAANEHVLISAPYNASGRYDSEDQTGTQMGIVADAKDLGSVWGLTYQRTKKRLFSSALLKRHVGLGTDGIGAIYVSDVSNLNAVPTPTLFYNFGANAGVVGTNASRDIDPDKTKNSVDALAFAQIGKVGFGDMDISSDEKTIYVTNLFDRKVYKLDATGTTASTATALPDFPSTSCSNGVARPWGLAYNHGKLYLAVTCTGENNGSKADLVGYIYAFDPIANTWDTAPKLTVPFNYKHGSLTKASDVSFTQPGGFFPWEDDLSGFNWKGGGFYSTFANPSPVISDIEFDEDGSMHIGVIDRSGFQTGHRNALPTATTAN